MTHLYTKLRLLAIIIAVLSWVNVEAQNKKLTQTNESKVSKFFGEPELFHKYLQSSHLEAEARIKAFVARTGEPRTYKDESGATISMVDIKNDRPIYFKTDNTDAGRGSGVHHILNNGRTGANLNGQGVTVYVWDGGSALGTHQELTGRTTNNDAAGADNHATHVSGTIAASGVVNAARGMAPRATLMNYDFNSDLSEMVGVSTVARLSNHSYGFLTGYNFTSGVWRWYGDTTVSRFEDSDFGKYDSYTEAIDVICNNYPNFLMVRSAGNDRDDRGTLSHQVWNGSAWSTRTWIRKPDGDYDCIPSSSVAKNILTIGAVQKMANGTYSTSSDVNLTLFSSWGPTDDGRIKPDVSAVGQFLYSASSSGNTSYLSQSGTSMSSPTVTGCLALLNQYWNSTGRPVLKSSTYKSLLIHTVDEAGTSLGPDYRFGWGLVNAERALTTMRSIGAGHSMAEITYTGTTINRTVVARGGEPLWLTLTWNDPAGRERTALNDRTPNLVNDIDVELIAPDGTTRTYPYRLDYRNPGAPATQGVNSLDNTEKIYLASPVTNGVYTIRITHKNGLTGGSQLLSLWVSGLRPVLSLSSFSPLGQSIGGTVTINGTGFRSNSTVYINGTAAATSFVNSTRLQATVPAGAVTSRIQVRNSGDSSVWSGTDLVVNGFCATPRYVNLGTPTNTTVSSITSTAFAGGTKYGFRADPSRRYQFSICNNTQAIAMSILNTSGQPVHQTTDAPLVCGNAYGAAVSFIPSTTDSFFVYVIGRGCSAITQSLQLDYVTAAISTVPAITSFTSPFASTGGTVTVNTQNMAASIIRQVTLNGVTCSFFNATANSFQFTVPSPAVSGPVVAYTNAGIAISPTDLTVGVACVNSTTNLGELLPSPTRQTVVIPTNTRARFTFPAYMYGRVYFSTCGSSVNTELRVYDPYSSLVASNNDNGSLCAGTAASLVFRPDSIGYNGGNYTLIVSRTGCAVTNAAVTLEYWTDLAPLELTSFAPTAARTGQTVTLTGVNLPAISTVRLGGTAPSSVAATNNTTANVVVGAGSSGSITISNGLGETSLAGFTFCTGPGTPTITPASNQTICTGGSVVLTAPASMDGYIWSNSQTTRSITVNSAGTYTVRTIQGVCTSDVSAGVTVSLQNCVNTFNGSGAWSTATNWSFNAVPTASDSVLIPTGRTVTINSGLANVGSLVMQSGSSITTAGTGTLNISRHVVNLVVSGTGTVVFNGIENQRVDSATITCDLTVNKASGNLVLIKTLAFRRLLNIVSGGITTNGRLILLSDANGTGLILPTSTISGMVTVQRNIATTQLNGLGYRMLASPVSGQAFTGITSTGAPFTPVINTQYNTAGVPSIVRPYPNIFQYEQSRLHGANNTFGFGWMVPTVANIEVGRGYNVQVSPTSTLQFRGTLQNGNLTVNLARGGFNNSGWALVGNPYPGPISWDVLRGSLTNIFDAIYVSRPTGQFTGQYSSYVNGVANNGGSSTIPAMQAFFVRVVNPNSSASLQFTNAARLTGYSNPSVLRTATETRTIIRISADAGGKSDQATVYWQQGATTGFDATLEAVKPATNADGYPTLWTNAGSNSLSIQALNTQPVYQHVIPMRLRANVTGNHTIKLDSALNLPSTWSIAVYDSTAGTLNNLPYSVNLNQTTTSVPLALVITDGSITSNQKLATNAKISLYPNPAQQVVTVVNHGTQAINRIQLIDATGRVLPVLQVQQGQTVQLNIADLAPGLYQVQIETTGGRSVLPLQKD